MGWFWADSTPTPAAPTAPHPLPRDGASPPPSCPMHNKMPPKPRADKASSPPGTCPYNPPDVPTPASNSSSPSPPSGLLSRLNPLNNMPMHLSNQKASSQTVDLPLSRETSTIPKADGSLWEYPSPQQMYNAMLRKGYTDTPQDAVESMVAVHNFLNEGAWAEIVGWEARFARGLGRGWDVCSRGEENADKVLQREPMSTDWQEAEVPAPQLVRFTGRPDEPTPKSQLMQLLAKAAPKTFESTPPFDRHDWFVKRCNKEGACRELRYVIDYYEGPPETTGEPVFYLDVRPAADGPGQVAERLVRWGGDVWWRASGGAVREQEKMKGR